MATFRNLLGVAAAAAFAIAAIVTPAALAERPDDKGGMLGVGRASVAVTSPLRPDDRPGARGAGAIVRSQQQFVPGVTDFPSRVGKAGELAAQARIDSAEEPARTVLVRVDEGGFDWRDAGIGALCATALMLGAVLCLMALRRGRIAVA
jgi:hypothetical protein